MDHILQVQQELEQQLNAEEYHRQHANVELKISNFIIRIASKQKQNHERSIRMVSIRLNLSCNSFWISFPLLLNCQIPFRYLISNENKNKRHRQFLTICIQDNIHLYTLMHHRLRSVLNMLDNDQVMNSTSWIFIWQNTWSTAVRIVVVKKKKTYWWWLIDSSNLIGRRVSPIEIEHWNSRFLNRKRFI